MSRLSEKMMMYFPLIVITTAFLLILFVVVQNMLPSEPLQQPACILHANENYTFHRVERGETLQSIAANYSITPELLAEINTACFDNPNDIVEDLVIRVPAPVRPATEAPLEPMPSPTP
jgi:hypothetical protein